MSKRMTDTEVQNVETDLRIIEGKLESVGRQVCDADGSGECWNHITRAVIEVQDAIGAAYKMVNGGMQ